MTLIITTLNENIDDNDNSNNIDSYEYKNPIRMTSTVTTF